MESVPAWKELLLGFAWGGAGRHDRPQRTRPERQGRAGSRRKKARVEDATKKRRSKTSSRRSSASSRHPRARALSMTCGAIIHPVFFPLRLIQAPLASRGHIHPHPWRSSSPLPSPSPPPPRRLAPGLSSSQPRPVSPTPVSSVFFHDPSSFPSPALRRYGSLDSCNGALR
jgi:hypothetical protein